MRILVVTNLYPPFYVGGYELRCEVIVNALRARGHEVQVLTSNHGVNGAEQPKNQAYVKRSLRVHGFFGHPWLGISALRKLETHNNTELTDAVETFKPDVVHVWNLGGISKSLTLTLQRLGLPVVFDVSDHWIARSLKADVWMDWWNRRTPSFMAQVTRFVWTVLGQRKRWDKLAPTNAVKDVEFKRLYFCSAALRRITASKGYDVAHAEVIHCSVDLDRFHGEPASAERPLKKLLYVGRLAEDKGAMTALRALALVKDQFDGELFVYGHGDADYTAQMHAFVAEHQLPVTFRQGTAAEMPAIYRAHDALVFTSEWEEPFALTPLEAMASGLPVIGTMTGGSAELFRHAENALTYQAGHADELAQRIIELATSGALRHRLAVNGQAEVSERCAEPVIVNRIESYLQTTVQNWQSYSSPGSEASVKKNFASSRRGSLAQLQPAQS